MEIITDLTKNNNTIIIAYERNLLLISTNKQELFYRGLCLQYFLTRYLIITPKITHCSLYNLYIRPAVLHTRFIRKYL